MTSPIGVLLSPVASVGRATLSMFSGTGAVALFAARAVAAAFAPPFFPGQILRQLLRIGYFSLPVVGLTAMFTGAALALNIYTGGARFNAEAVVPNIVGIGITRELGPVIASLMLAGRVSAAIAAEIGTMRVTEQIDALSTLSTNPYKYLIAPRLIAGVIAMPILVAIADILGVLGGFAISTQSLGFNPATYVTNTWNFLEASDINLGLIKAGFFGFLLTLMGCYHGFTSRGGAQGVGRATTSAVASAMILIVAANYILTSILT